MKHLRKLLIVPEAVALCVCGFGCLLILAAGPVEIWCQYRRTGKKYGNIAPGW